ncbi:MAG TPA: entericidin [Burkholderiales bacterium]|nr:entericidin [Burkholderiales bacterium]
MGKPTFRRMLSALLVGASLGMLSGCNTVAGLGQDLQDLGRWIRGESSQHRA